MGGMVNVWGQFSGRVPLNCVCLYLAMRDGLIVSFVSHCVADAKGRQIVSGIRADGGATAGAGGPIVRLGLCQ